MLRPKRKLPSVIDILLAYLGGTTSPLRVWGLTRLLLVNSVEALTSALRLRGGGHAFVPSIGSGNLHAWPTPAHAFARDYETEMQMQCMDCDAARAASSRLSLLGPTLFLIRIASLFRSSTPLPACPPACPYAHFHPSIHPSISPILR